MSIERKIPRASDDKENLGLGMMPETYPKTGR